MPRRRTRWTEGVDARLGRTLNEIFLAIPPSEARALFHRVRTEAAAAQLTCTDGDGERALASILIRPRIIRPEQEAYFHKTCLDLDRALEKLPRLFLDDERVRALLPFAEREEQWFRDLLPGVGHRPQTVVARLDANADFADDDWDGQFHFFGATTIGVGGMYAAPKVAEILMKHVVPAMQRIAPSLVVRPQDDQRQLLLEQLTLHAQATRRRRLHTAFVHERDRGSGPSELPFLVEHLTSQGVPAVLVDPRELHVRDDELYAGDLPIDIVYRDAPLARFAALEDEGADLSALKHAFRENQVVSSLAGELDHASTFEVLTTPELASHFTMRQQRIFRHHVPWTRMVRDTRTTDLDGAPIDLVPWLRRNKDRLVLKPNRSRGGDGIVLGPHVDLAQWDDALQAALAATDAQAGDVVAQRYVEVRVKDFPVLRDDGSISIEELYVVGGFLATPRGVGILGRASKQRSVDVGPTGGLTGILVLA